MPMSDKLTPLALNAKDAAAYLGSRQLLDDMRAADWLRPVIAGHRRTLFDASELRTCYARVRAGEYPGASK